MVHKNCNLIFIPRNFRNILAKSVSFYLESKQVFFYGGTYHKSQSAVFMLPENGVPSPVVGTVCSPRIWCVENVQLFGPPCIKTK